MNCPPLNKHQTVQKQRSCGALPQRSCGAEAAGGLAPQGGLQLPEVADVPRLALGPANHQHQPLR